MVKIKSSIMVLVLLSSFLQAEEVFMTNQRYQCFLTFTMNQKKEMTKLSVDEMMKNQIKIMIDDKKVFHMNDRNKTVFKYIGNDIYGNQDSIVTLAKINNAPHFLLNTPFNKNAIPFYLCSTTNKWDMYE